MGWSGMKNGALLPVAEGRFDALITIDQGFEYPVTFRPRRWVKMSLSEVSEEGKFAVTV